MKHPTTLAVLLVTALPCGAAAQSLYTTIAAAPTALDDEADAGLREHSFLLVEPPKPRDFAVHDLVTIIIDEVSRSESKQTLDTEKDYTITAAMREFPSLRHLLELQLQNGPTQRTASLDVRGKHEFAGEGETKRSDRFIARIAAKIIDVKPNGTLVLEASKQIVKGREIQTIVLSGICRQEDVTEQNTITSSQLADLRIVQHTEGEVAKAGEKGLIPRVLETIFNF